MAGNWLLFFEREYPNAIAALKEGGLYDDGWTNVRAHCVAQAAAGYVLAHHLRADLLSVVTACLIHDARKRIEIETLRSVPQEEKGAVRATLELEGKSWLQQFGIDESIAALAGSNIPAPFDPKTMPFADVLDRPSEVQIVHYLDMVTMEDQIVPWETRLVEVEKKPGVMAFNIAFKDRYGGLDINEVQRLFCVLEQHALESRLRIEPRSLITWINETARHVPD